MCGGTSQSCWNSLVTIGGEERCGVACFHPSLIHAVTVRATQSKDKMSELSNCFPGLTRMCWPDTLLAQIF